MKEEMRDIQQRNETIIRWELSLVTDAYNQISKRKSRRRKRAVKMKTIFSSITRDLEFTVGNEKSIIHNSE